jgi:hypothetical protein
MYAFLPTGKKCIYSGSIEFWRLRTDEFAMAFFAAVWLLKISSLQEVLEMLGKVTVGQSHE